MKKIVLAHINLKKSETNEVKLHQFVVDIRSCFDAKYVCLWHLNKKLNELFWIYDTDHETFLDEYANVSDAIDIGSIMQTKNPVLTNEIVNDLKDEDKVWAIKENVVAYAGFPLISNGNALGILEIFNDKVFSPRDFDMASGFISWNGSQ
jgi:two-component system, NtrC family, sensor kinase